MKFTSKTATRTALAAITLGLLVPALPAQDTRPTTQTSADSADTRPATRPARERRSAERTTGRLANRFGSTMRSATGNEEFAVAVEEAHKADVWNSRDAVKTDFALTFGGSEMINGTMTMSTDGARSRIEDKSGWVLTFDGDKAWIAPPDADLDKPRFHALTWPYFLAAPYKLQDPGTNLRPMPRARPLMGQDHDTARLTFTAGTGDAPDDWYIVYKDQKTGVMKAMAYIVTYDADQNDAEENPHAIVYKDHDGIDGVPVPMTWEFYNWNFQDGVHGEPIGVAKLSNMEFVSAGPETFARPDGAVEAPLP